MIRREQYEGMALLIDFIVHDKRTGCSCTKVRVRLDGLPLHEQGCLWARFLCSVTV